MNTPTFSAVLAIACILLALWDFKLYEDSRKPKWLVWAGVQIALAVMNTMVAVAGFIE